MVRVRIERREHVRVRERKNEDREGEKARVRETKNEGFRLSDRTKGLDTSGVRTRGRARGRQGGLIVEWEQGREKSMRY